MGNWGGTWNGVHMLSGFLVSFDWLIQSFKFEWKREGDPIMVHNLWTTVWRDLKRSLWLLICCRWTWRPFRFLFFLRFFSISCDEFSFISLVFESSATCGENFFTIGQIQNNNFVWKMLMMIFIGLFLNLRLYINGKKLNGFLWFLTNINLTILSRLSFLCFQFWKGAIKFSTK